MEFEIPETLANALLGMINEDSLLAKRLSEYGLSRGKRVVPSHLFDATSLNTLYGLCQTANERGLMFQMVQQRHGLRIDHSKRFRGMPCLLKSTESKE